MHVQSGVEALRRARSEVGKLKADAAEQEIALSEKQAKANHALDQIGATVRAATDKKEEMHELKKNIEKENEILQIRYGIDFLIVNCLIYFQSTYEIRYSIAN